MDRILAAAAASAKQEVPILGQQRPAMSGLNINGMTMTINEIAQLPETEFRELMLAVIINLVGGVYSPPPIPADEATEAPEDESEEVAEEATEDEELDSED